MYEVFTTQADLDAVTARDGTKTLKYSKDPRVICRVYTSRKKTISMTYSFKGTTGRLPLGDGNKLAQALDQHEADLALLKAGHDPGERGRIERSQVAAARREAITEGLTGDTAFTDILDAYIQAVRAGTSSKKRTKYTRGTIAAKVSVINGVRAYFEQPGRDRPVAEIETVDLETCLDAKVADHPAAARRRRIELVILFKWLRRRARLPKDFVNPCDNLSEFEKAETRRST